MNPDATDRNATTDDDLAAAADAVLEAGAGGDEEARSSDVNDFALRLARAENELARTKMDLLKSQAEFENFRKRVRRDAEEELRYAFVPLIRDLLPVIDNLERATQAAAGNVSAAGLVEGVHLVIQQFSAVLAQHGCQRMGALGAEFDPHHHQALAQEPSEHPAGYVSRELQAGFILHDRVIRPAQVFVSTGPAAGANAGS